MTKTKIFPWTVLLSAIAAGAASVQAQSILEEIIVTAQKRTESLQEVPISIAVVDAEAIAKTGIRSVREMAEFVPNVTISAGNDNNTAVRIRGVGTNTRNIGFDTRVGVYLDGVYLGQSPAQNMDILDLERIEVLRGPQGTLFGKNTVAGAINLISQKPSDEFSAELRGEYGNYASHRVSAVVNAPISGQLNSRFSVSDNHRDGYIDNITTGNEQGEQDGTTYRGQLTYTGGNYAINFAADYLESSRVSSSGEAVTDWSGSVSPDPFAPQRLEVSNNVDNAEKRKILGLSTTIDFDFDNGYSLKSITAYRDTSSKRGSDTDHSALDILILDYPDEYEQLTQEIQLISPNDSSFKYVAGLYYYNEEAKTERTIALGADIGTVFSVLAPPLAPLGPLFDGANVGTSGEVDTESWAVYINGSYDLTDRLTLGFGARYTSEEKAVDYGVLGDVVVGVPVTAIFSLAADTVVNGQTVAQTNDKNSYTDFSPSVSLGYLINDNTNLYAKYSSAFKSGGFNVDFVSQTAFDSGIAFDTETVDSYEIGIKGSALENRLRYSVSVFQMEFDDYQINQFIDLGNGLTSITIKNAAEVTSKGLEAEVVWLATENLLLQGSVGKTDAKFNSFVGGGTAKNPGGLGADVSGNELPISPGLSAAMTVQHTIPLGQLDVSWVTRLDWNYSDEYYTTADNVTTNGSGSTIPFGFVDSYSLLNARVGMESHNWSAFLWARNLLDEEYSTGGGSDALGTIFEVQGEPLTYGVELSYNF